MRERIEATLDRFGVRFDTWFSERSLHDGGKIEAAIEYLRGRGHVYESEGAVWLRTSELGDDKDRVLVRSDGEPTYFAADIAYHRDKLERGAERMIDPVGADHHGYVPRMRAAIEALGHDPDLYEAPIMQFVRLVEGGERARMSKRKGEFASLDELIDDIGVDAARFFMLQRSHDTALDLDLELARRASQDNPVYYVQYAHARIASILRKAVAEGSARLATDDGGRRGGAGEAAQRRRSALAAPAEPAERALVQRLLELPAEAGGRRRAPRSAPPGRLRDGDRGRLPRLLPGLPGGRGGRRARAGPPGDLRGREAGDRPHPRICSASAPRTGCSGGPTRREMAPRGRC